MKLNFIKNNFIKIFSFQFLKRINKRKLIRANLKNEESNSLTSKNNESSNYLLSTAITTNVVIPQSILSWDEFLANYRLVNSINFQSDTKNIHSTLRKYIKNN